MKKLHLIAAMALLCAGCIFTACERELVTPPASETAPPPQVKEAPVIPDQYIVRFDERLIPSARKRLDINTVHDRTDKVRKMTALQADVTAEIDAVLHDHAIAESQVLYRYTSVQSGAALRLDKAAMARLKADPRVALIEADQMAELPDKALPRPEPMPVAPRSQTLPCGVAMVGGPESYFTLEWIWIVDTGIDMDHPDLNTIPVPASVSYVDATPNDDCYGHGTWVAGVAAGWDNGFGVVGVSPGARVASVKVLDCAGTSPISRILAGLNHIGTWSLQGDAVTINASTPHGVVLNNCASTSAYLPAINALADDQVWIVLPAGDANSDANYYQPGCINRDHVYTVTSMTCDATWSYGSNYGVPTIDWIAPGHSTLTTTINGSYGAYYGSSLAAAHICGILHSSTYAPQPWGYVYHNGSYYTAAHR